MSLTFYRGRWDAAVSSQHARLWLGIESEESGGDASSRCSNEISWFAPFDNAEAEAEMEFMSLLDEIRTLEII